MNATQLTREQKTTVVNKFFAELAEILSEKNGCTITMRAIPKPEEGTNDGERDKKGA